MENPAADPKTTALLNATFKELMPREAIMGHGTAESLEMVNKTFGERMRPLAEKLDAFAADGSKVLSGEDILALQSDMADMKSALENVRKNGLNETVMTSHEGKEILGDNGVAITKTTEVDSSLLDEMEKLLADVSIQIADARNVSVMRSRQVFLEEVKAMLSPESVPGGDKVMSSSAATSNNIVFQFKLARKEFVELIRDYSLGTLPMVKGLHFVKAQFRALLEAGERIKNGGEDPGLAMIDVRRIMLGEVGLSNVIEAKILGFKPGDVDPATEESNIVGSKALGSGMAGKTYLLKTKSGGKLVFKSEFDSRTGMSGMLLGMNGAYRDAQKTVNLNLAGVRLRGSGRQVLRRQPRRAVRLFHGEGRGLRWRRILQKAQEQRRKRHCAGQPVQDGYAGPGASQRPGLGRTEAQQAYVA